MVPRLAVFALVLVGGLAGALPSVAADVAKGTRLAQQWCGNCHVIGNTAPAAGTVQQGPPNFRTIAEGRTPDQMRVFLSKPHGAMPDLALTRSEIDDVIAYIETLR